MKKALSLIFPLVLTAFLFSSCKKNYDCECTNINNEKEMYVVNATNKNQAKKNCDEKSLLGHCELADEE